MKATTMKAFAVTLMLATGGLASAAEHKAGPADAARADIQKTFGFVPQFLLRFPDAALPGA